MPGGECMPAALGAWFTMVSTMVKPKPKNAVVRCLDGTDAQILATKCIIVRGERRETHVQALTHDQKAPTNNNIDVCQH